MGNNSYDSLLLLASEGKNKANSIQEVVDLVNEIKLNYKENNYEWYNALREKKIRLEDKIMSIVYSLYSNDKPIGAMILNTEEKKNFVEHFKSLLNGDVEELFDIIVQGENEESFSKLNLEQLLDGESYHIFPKGQREHYLHDFKPTARLTINVNKENYILLSKVLIDIYKYDSQRKIIESKIMGPNRLGLMTDQAVIYLAEADLELAKEISQRIKSLLPEDALIEHYPKGMEKLTTGISYSETIDGQLMNPSESRVPIVAKAVVESLLTGNRLQKILPRMLQRYGYNSKHPALMSQVTKDIYFKTELSDTNLETVVDSQSEDIKNFISDPENFLYDNNLNTNHLNEISDIPNSGKVIFHKTGNSGYDIKYVDSSYSIDVTSTLDCYFLNTQFKEIERNTVEYVDIKKNTPERKFLFLGGMLKGSVIVTELDENNYRVYYDCRYHSSQLYDNVIMAIDENGHDRTKACILMYFDVKQWKLALQKRNDSKDPNSKFNELIIRYPNNYSKVSSQKEFEHYRKSVHDKINVFHMKLGKTGLFKRNHKTPDGNDTIYWLKLANEIKEKLKEKSVNLYKEIDKLESKYRNEMNEKKALVIKENIEINKAVNNKEQQEFNEIYAQLLEVENITFLQDIKQKGNIDDTLRLEDTGAAPFEFDIHNKASVIERYENLSYLHSITKNIEFNHAFREGIKNYKKETIPGFKGAMGTLELKTLYLSHGLTAKERGALYQHVQDVSYAEYIEKVLGETGRISEFFYRNGSKLNRLIPQDFYLSAIKSRSGGRCYPLVRAMSIALAKNGQKGADILIDKLYIAAANPSEKDSVLLRDSLIKLHSNTAAIEASHVYGEGNLKNIQELLDSRDETMMLAINSKSHSMLIGKKIEGEVIYYFYDPNFGVFSFKSSEQLFLALKSFFIEKQFASYYSAFGKDDDPIFKTVNIDIGKMKLVSIGNGLEVDDLSNTESLSIVEARRNTLNKIIKMQNEAYDDLQLKNSLIIFDARQWSEKINLATHKLLLENGLDELWVPLFSTVEETEGGGYRIQFIHIREPDLTHWAKTTDKTFIEFHQYSLDNITEFNHYYRVVDNDFKLRPQSKEGGAIDGLNAGIAIQSIIQWAEERNHIETPQTSSMSNLAIALKLHNYLNYTLIAHASLKDSIQVSRLVKNLLNKEGKAATSTVNLFSSSLEKVANENLGLLFNGALIGFDAYEVYAAENEPQQIIFGTQLAFDSASFITSTASISAGSMGYTTASASLGSMGIIVAGLGIGFTALAHNFASIGENAKMVGRYFNALDEAYKGNGYECSANNNVLVPKFGAIFKEINLKNNQIEFDSQYIYRTSPKSAGGGKNNYIFWAGNFPTIVNDRQEAINIRDGIGHNESIRTVDFSLQEIIFLPITPKSYIKYDYNLLPGATTRHDLGFDVIRRLEESEKFDYDFYIFPSENIITNINHEYVKTSINIILDSKGQNLIIPELPSEWHDYIEYKIQGNGGKYRISLNEGVGIKISDNLDCGVPSQWFIDITNCNDKSVAFFDEKIKIGNIGISLEGQNVESEFFIVDEFNEVKKINYKEKNISIASIDESYWKDNISGFKEHLHNLTREYELLQQYVVIENFQFQGDNLGRAYYEVENERFIFTSSTEQEKKKGILGAVLGNMAIFYSLEIPLIWIVDIDSGKVLTDHRLMNSNKQLFQIFQLWENEGSIYFSCHYQDTQEVANYRIKAGEVELISLSATESLINDLIKIPTQYDLNLLSNTLKNYFIDDINTGEKKHEFSKYLADLVMISGRNDNQAYYRYWFRKNDNKLIKPDLSPPLDYGIYPVDDILAQVHWTIPEDLNLIGTLFDSDNTEIFYFYSDKYKLLYRQKSTEDQSAKPSGLPLHITSLDSAFMWQGRIMTIDIRGVVSQVNADGESLPVALNDKWFEERSCWWRDIYFLYGDTPILALLGIRNAYSDKVIPAWYVHGKLVIAHQLSSENELQFLGQTQNNSGALLFDMTKKKLYEQPFSTESELNKAFASNAELLEPLSLPPIIELYPEVSFNNIKSITGGLLISTENGEILYIDLLSVQSGNSLHHLNSSLIIKGGNGNDTLRPSIIGSIKYIVLSGGEGVDYYFINQDVWLNYQTIIIDNNSYDRQMDFIILPELDMATLIMSRREDDLVVFDKNQSTSLILRQVFGLHSDAHQHLKIRMGYQSNDMSLSKFTGNSLYAEKFLNVEDSNHERILSNEQQSQLIMDKIASFDSGSNLSQYKSIDLLPSEKILSTNVSFSDPYLR